MDCSPSDSSVHGIFQARILEWVAIFFSKGSFQLKKKTGPKTEPWSRHLEFERQTQQRNLRRSSQRGKRPPCKPSDDGISRRKRGQLSDNTSLDLRTIQLGNVEVPGGGGDFCGVDGRGQPGWNRFKKAWKESNEGQQV